MDWNAAEGVTPFHHGVVIMRVRDRDAGQAAQPLDDLAGRSIDQRDAVPQHVAGSCAHQQRALADGELRLHADADETGLVLAEAIGMPSRERIERGPSLPRGWNELPIIEADGALRRRLFRRRELAG